jgi:hypothetical protein
MLALAFPTRDPQRQVIIRSHLFRLETSWASVRLPEHPDQRRDTVEIGSLDPHTLKH